MKTLTFSLTFVVALVLYGVGFFVPETRGIENVVDGHVVLNDAEMAQLIGGEPETHEPFPGFEPAGERTECIGIPQEDCDDVPTETVIHQKFRCISCDGRDGDEQYKIDNSAPWKVNHKCKNRYDYCGYTSWTWRIFSSCIIKLNKKCGNFMPF